MRNEAIITEYVECIKKIYGEHLKKVILFGSYARKENTDMSDIDIMILLDIGDDMAKKYQSELFDRTYDFSLNYDIEFNPISHEERLFEKWLPAYPFFQNIKKDGVILYGAA